MLQAMSKNRPTFEILAEKLRIVFVFNQQRNLRKFTRCFFVCMLFTI